MSASSLILRHFLLFAPHSTGITDNPKSVCSTSLPNWQFFSKEQPSQLRLPPIQTSLIVTRPQKVWRRTTQHLSPKFYYMFLHSQQFSISTYGFFDFKIRGRFWRWKQLIVTDLYLVDVQQFTIQFASWNFSEKDICSSNFALPHHQWLLNRVLYNLFAPKNSITFNGGETHFQTYCIWAE